MQVDCDNIKAKELLGKLDCDAFAPVPGNAVYAVVVQNIYFSGAEHILYIGSSKNVQKRRESRSHPYSICLNRFQGIYRNVCLKYFYSESMLEDEAFLIQHLSPPLNKQLNQRWSKPKTNKYRNAKQSS